MIIEEAYLSHYGKKGMKWGTRKLRKTHDHALSAKGQVERDKRNRDPKTQQRQREIELKTQELVVRALAKPASAVHIVQEDRTLVVNGRDFAEVVVGRIGNSRIDPFPDSLIRTTNHGRR